VKEWLSLKEGENQLKPVINFVLLVTVSLAAFGFGLHHSSYLPFKNNQWKAHRWTSDMCRANKLDPKQCTLPIHAPGAEIAYFDVCMEHGELKRIQ
jgi:hypothetical protein